MIGMVNGKRDRNLTPRWDMEDLVPGQVLLRIAHHVEFNLRRVGVRFVERKWHMGKRWWKWVTVDPIIIRVTRLRDPFFETAVSPLYYFDTETDDPDDGSYLQ